MLSDMAHEFFANNPAMAGPMIAMFIFLVVFTVAGLRAWRLSPDHAERMANLALEGESEEAGDE